MTPLAVLNDALLADAEVSALTRAVYAVSGVEDGPALILNAQENAVLTMGGDLSTTQMTLSVTVVASTYDLAYEMQQAVKRALHTKTFSAQGFELAAIQYDSHGQASLSQTGKSYLINLTFSCQARRI